MDVSQLPDLGFSWEEILATLQTTGVDLAFNVVKAILIFYIGKFVVGIIVRTIRKIMAKRDIEDTLENFVLSLLRMVLMLFVIIATVGALGMQTTSFIAVLGAAGLAIGLA
jgi:small conductance mechanosensitive channel